MRLITPRAFWLPSLLSGFAMFTLSFTWHYHVLNDLKHIGTLLPLYVLFSIAGYLLMGLFMTMLLLGLQSFGWVGKRENPIGKITFFGSALGVLLGCVLLAITLPTREHLVVAHIWADLAWQVIEQTSGGLFAGIGLSIHRTWANLQHEGAM
jgi:hypothetical protein